MNILIVGAGGVGGYFGALLAQQGHEVTFVARGPHLRAIQERGLQILSVNGDFLVSPARATDGTEMPDRPEYVIVAVKDYQLAEAVPLITSITAPTTTVVPLLNGLDAHERLAAAVGEARVVGGLCSLVSLIESPGVIRQPSQLRRVVLGELNGSRSERVENLIQAWQAAGAEAIHAHDIHAALWRKFIFIAPFGSVTALARANAGEMLACAETRELFVQGMREIEQLARASGVRLPDDAVPQALATAEAFEPAATSSMQRDVDAGRPFELEAFAGKVVRLGESLDIPTPIHRTIYGLLRPALLRAQLRSGDGA
jgi:2-dehydropantoate 2-reductase